MSSLGGREGLSYVKDAALCPDWLKRPTDTDSSVLNTAQGTGYHDLKGAKGGRRQQGILSDFSPASDNLTILDASLRRIPMTISHQSEWKRQGENTEPNRQLVLSRRLTKLTSTYPSKRKKCKLIRLEMKKELLEQTPVKSRRQQNIPDFHLKEMHKFSNYRPAQIKPRRYKQFTQADNEIRAVFHKSRIGRIHYWIPLNL